MEIANTSGFLQALDQFNRKYHLAYNKEKRRYKRELRESGFADPTLSLADFLEINAGIATTWWTPSDRRAAFRRVGILQNRLDASKVDRSKFVFPSPPPTATAAAAAAPHLPPSPKGLAKGGNAYFKRKYEDLSAAYEELRNVEVGPSLAGILVPVVVQRTKGAGCKRITDGHGSAVLSKLLEMRATARMAAEAETLRKANAAQVRAAKKAAGDEAAAAQLELWEICRGGCVCGPVGEDGAESAAGHVCPVAGLVLCPHCDTLKKRRCAVAACKVAAAAEVAAGAGCAPWGLSDDEGGEDEGGED